MSKAKSDTLSWYRLYPGIVTTDLMGMPLTHAGAYLRLHCLYWHDNMKLPEDEVVLFRKAGARTAEEQAAVREIIDEFFPVGPDGKHTNERLDEHLAHVTAFGEQQRAKAKAGWAARRQPSRVEATHPSSTSADLDNVDF